MGWGGLGLGAVCGGPAGVAAASAISQMYPVRMMLFLRGYGVNFSNVSARELYHRRPPVTERIGFDQNCPTCGFRFLERLAEIGDFIPGHFPSVRVRQMSVGDEDGQ